MAYSIIREQLDNGRIKFSLGWYGHVSKGNEMSATLSGDGCIELVVEKEYLYPQEAESFAALILEARRERVSKEISRRKEWDAKHGDTKAHFGVGVDLSINDGVAVLRTAPIDDGKIFFNGKWLHIYRTDLKDDVGLKLDGFDREFLQSLVMFGVRVTETGFGIISAMSDH